MIIAGGGYSVVIDNYFNTMEEKDLTYVCSKEDLNNIVNNIKSKIKKQIGIPIQSLYVGLRHNWEFEVMFNT